MDLILFIEVTLFLLDPSFKSNISPLMEAETYFFLLLSKRKYVNERHKKVKTEIIEILKWKKTTEKRRIEKKVTKDSIDRKISFPLDSMIFSWLAIFIFSLS